MASVCTSSDSTDLDGLRRFLRAEDTESRLLPLEMLRDHADEANATTRRTCDLDHVRSGWVERHAPDRWSTTSAAITGAVSKAASHARNAEIFEAYRSIYPGLKSTFRLMAEKMP